MLPRHVDDPFHLYIRKDGYNYSTITANNARKYEGLEEQSPNVELEMKIRRYDNYSRKLSRTFYI
ncbi:hypothetical protein CRYUN_Cryun09bG0139100 [Craigia yunnanensis]